VVVVVVAVVLVEVVELVVVEEGHVVTRSVSRHIQLISNTFKRVMFNS
jgi:hypothetical protein